MQQQPLLNPRCERGGPQFTAVTWTTAAAGITAVAQQLHQLAWCSLLMSTSSQQPHGNEQHHHHQQQSSAQDAGAVDPVLRQQLRVYMTARAQWRQRQQSAVPLAPAEKWMTLQHEEQVSQFNRVELAGQGQAFSLKGMPCSLCPSQDGCCRCRSRPHLMCTTTTFISYTKLAHLILSTSILCSCLLLVSCNALELMWNVLQCFVSAGA